MARKEPRAIELIFWTSNISEMTFLICTLRYIGQEMFHEADEILTNVVNNPLRFDPHQSPFSLLPCGWKGTSWQKNMTYESTTGNVHVLKQWFIWSSRHLFKTRIQRKQNEFLCLRDFYQHQSVGADRPNMVKGRAHEDFLVYFTSHLLNSADWNLLWNMYCISAGHKLPSFPLFAAPMTVLYRELNFKFLWD